MLLFNGFEQILMCVIKNTSHFDDETPKGEKVPAEKRFDDAMTALFGKFYEARHVKESHEISLDEILYILHLKKQCLRHETAIKKVMRERFKSSNDKSEIHDQLGILHAYRLTKGYGYQRKTNLPFQFCLDEIALT